MNALKRLRLKSMLRNCNYVLAGTVIKQQYYDSTRRIEVNQLIDTFMADPGFEHALKLIDFNDMMVFYFTESCRGGLYVRKTEQGGETFKTPPTRQDQFESSAYPTEKRNAAYPPVQDSVQITDIPETEADLHKSLHLQQIKESEDWMDDMISRKSKSSTSESTHEKHTHQGEGLSATAILTEDAPAALADEPHVVDPYLVEPQSFDPQVVESSTFGPHIIESQTVETPLFEPHIIESQTVETPLFEPHIIESQPVEPPLFEPHIIESQTVETPIFEPHIIEQQVVEPLITEPHIIESQQALPKPSSFELKPPVLKQRDYSNVIATLELDIHTLSKQLEDCRRKLASFPVDERQLKAWIKSLEAAIHEFADAIDLLEAPPR